MEPLPTSDATKRTRTWSVSATYAPMSTEDSIHPPVVPAPVGPTTSALVQLTPPSSERSTLNTSAPGDAPSSFEYQRTYRRVAVAEPSRSKRGENSAVLPPSTSFSPRPPPTLPWPVNQQRVPGLGELSFSGCAAVPIGSARVHSPVVALFGDPMVQPWSPAASKS